MLLDINDYKKGVSRNVSKIKYLYFFISIILIIGLSFLNSSFKYYEYYKVSLEYKENSFNMYVLTNDVNKITKNNKIIIEKEIFAYNIDNISEENYYVNGNYFKKVKIIIKDLKLKDNEITESRIIIKKDTIIGYLFKTIWR